MASEIYNKAKNMLGSIGAAQTMMELFPLQFHFSDDLSFSTSFDLIAILFEQLGIPKEEIVKIVTEALCGDINPDSEGKGVLSKIEQAVKIALEANIINILNCSTNPIISDKLLDDYIDGKGDGITLSVAEIDFTGVLKRSPFVEDDENKRSYFYFDTDEYNPSTIYKSVDFNAYLWYIINKSDNSLEEERVWNKRYPKSADEKKTEKNLKKQIITCKYLDDDYANSDKIQVHICGARNGEADNYCKTRKLGDKTKTWSLNKTLFEFNHDFISSIKLYETRTIVAEIIQYFLGNGNFNVNLGLSINEEIIDGKVQQIIKNVVEGNDLEINDCYFTFSNEEYNEMLEKSEQYRTIPDKLLDNLSNITNTSTLQENKTIVNQTLTDLTVTPAQDPSATVGLNFEYDWHTELIRMLIYPLIRPLFTPKVLFLLLLNQKIMGSLEDIDELDVNKFLERFLGTIFVIIKQIIVTLIEILIEKFLEPIIEKLTEFVELLGQLMIMETLLHYKQLLESIYNSCMIGFDGSNINSIIDNVNYADIIPAQVEPEQSIC